MLTALIERNLTKVAAWEADRGDRPFVCFCCRAEVTLRRGGARAAHFAHKPPVTCQYGAGESDEHRRCKLELFEHLVGHPRVTKCEMERDLRTVRPDLSAYIAGVPVAIEVQLSSLSLERIAYRTIEYARKGIYVLWLPVHNVSLKRETYSLRPWERWLHALYFGRVYYWQEGLKILPVHFREHRMEVHGRMKDYQKISRRLKVPIDGRPVLLTDDFKPFKREAWAALDYNVPPSLLMVDRQPQWWRSAP